MHTRQVGFLHIEQVTCVTNREVIAPPTWALHEPHFPNGTVNDRGVSTLGWSFSGDLSACMHAPARHLPGGLETC